MVSTTSFLNSGVYRLFGTPFGIKITPPVKHYIILSNKWGAVHTRKAVFLVSIYSPLVSSFSGGNIFMKLSAAPTRSSFFIISGTSCGRKTTDLRKLLYDGTHHFSFPHPYAVCRCRPGSSCLRWMSRHSARALHPRGSTRLLSYSSRLALRQFQFSFPRGVQNLRNSPASFHAISDTAYRRGNSNSSRCSGVSTCSDHNAAS